MPRQKSDLVRQLLIWYRHHARDLPWRRTQDPYAIWISEVMLQQTQVKTVLPYWARWMSALPTIEALANAPAERIHKLWEGLGYYTRVRNLQKAARHIMDHHGGVFPRNMDQVLALPGIGRYTAGAICSIAFDQPAPILDGNVVRVLTRHFGVTGNPKDKKTNRRLWELAGELAGWASRMPGGSRTAQLNQALMELGALVCTPQHPQCGLCPAAGGCFAHRHHQVSKLPNLEKRPRAIPRRFAAFIVEHNGKFLVRQRPAGVVNAHLWEFPNIELAIPGAALQKAARDVLGFRLGPLARLCQIRHSITRYRICLDAFTVGSNHVIPANVAGEWLVPAALAKLPFPSAHRKILEILREAGPPATKHTKHTKQTKR
ncbi:MAG TPA: A/G-specific adenine glycosylase [Verrucomicrobiae bacterium]|nr:A/G-specific adenine glycosylase [Verrucomicrobiae bacterium]